MDAAGAADGSQTPARRARWRRRLLRTVAVGLLIALVVKVQPQLREAVSSLEHVSWTWLLGACALELASESGFVVAWREVIDPQRTLASVTASDRATSRRLAWAQLGVGTVIPGGSLSGAGLGAVTLHRLGMPAEVVAARQLSLTMLNTTLDALVLVVCGTGLAAGLLPGSRDLALTLLPAGVAAAGVAVAVLAGPRAAGLATRLRSSHQRVSASFAALAGAVAATRRLPAQADGRRAVAGAVAFLGFDALVLWTALHAVHAHPMPSYAVMLMAYVVGALGASLPLPGGVGAVGGIAGMLILYGVGRTGAIAAALLHAAISLLVPLFGGAVAWAGLRRAHNRRERSAEGPA